MEKCFSIVGAVPCVSFRVRLVGMLLLIVGAMASLSAPCPCSDPSLCLPLNVSREKEIVVFSVEGMSDSLNWHQYDWDHLTTIIYFHPEVDQELVCYAHSKGVRVIAAGEFSRASLYNTTEQKQWVNSALNRSLINHLDGINLDIEFALNASEAHLLTVMVQLVTQAFHQAIPGSKVSFDTVGEPYSGARQYDYVKLAGIVDYLVIMAYDESFAAGVKGVATSHDALSVTERGLRVYFSHNIPPEKLVLAVPWYGYDFPCTAYSQMDNICHLGGFECWHCEDNGGAVQMKYRDIMRLVDKNLTSSPVWNDTCDSVSITYKNDTTGITHQVWYDTPSSLTLRYYLAHSTGLLGVGMWTADSLDYSADPQAKQETKAMWATIAQFVEWEKFEKKKKKGRKMIF